MKQIYLLCNAHLDPVWQWEWEEGLAEALSTFRIAADFCEQFDGFVFNHNEAALYQWVEEYEPALFARIQTLVRQGKWHIIGGWYIQPDCNMPSAESILRQIAVGRRYFAEKFGSRPTTAINFDSFGHSRGLVQLLKKCGYDSYICIRPPKESCGAPGEDFAWIGYDGSAIRVHLANEGYNSALGKAAEKIEAYCASHPGQERLLVLWGVGNHGGGPSRKDLQDIAALMDQYRAQGVEMRHSTPEAFFSGLPLESLPRHEADLNPSMVGCYTSMVRIKQKHRQLENALWQTEKICCAAELQAGLHTDWTKLEEAQQLLLFHEFHDILPGTCIQRAEESSLRAMDRGLDILSRARMRAFAALADGQPPMEEGTIPLFVYNPHPYAVRRVMTCEFQLPDNHWDGTCTDYEVFCGGKKVASQLEKEDSNIPLDWRKRLTFEADLAPFSLTPVCCKPFIRPSVPVPEQPEGPILSLDNGRVRVEIDKATGWLAGYTVQGASFLKKGAGRLLVLQDNEDPWGMCVDRFREVCGEFVLADAEQAGAIAGLKAPLAPVRIIEQGAVRTVVEAVFVYDRSAAVVQYALANQADSLEIRIRLLWMQPDKMVKLSLPAAMDGAACWGQVMGGRDRMREDGRENVAQQWVAVTGQGRAWTVINDGLYAHDFCGGELRFTLLRSPAYCAHPIGDRTILRQDRFSPRIDIGEREFRLVIQAGEEAARMAAVDREAQIENEPPFAHTFFPSGTPCEKGPAMELDNRQVLLTAWRRDETGYLVRLYNPSDREQPVHMRWMGEVLQPELTLAPREMQAFRLEGHTLQPCPLDGQNETA